MTTRRYSIEVPGKDLDDNDYVTISDAAARAANYDGECYLCVWVPDPVWSGSMRQVRATTHELALFRQLAMIGGTRS